jgi:hypothetical protein
MTRVPELHHWILEKGPGEAWYGWHHWFEAGKPLLSGPHSFCNLSLPLLYLIYFDMDACRLDMETRSAMLMVLSPASTALVSARVMSTSCARSTSFPGHLTPSWPGILHWLLGPSFFAWRRKMAIHPMPNLATRAPWTPPPCHGPQSLPVPQRRNSPFRTKPWRPPLLTTVSPQSLLEISLYPVSIFL